MNKYQHIFFDLDRTLWDFDENSKKVLSDLFFHYKLNLLIDTVQEFINKYQEINELLWQDYRDNKIVKEELRLKRFESTLKYFSINDKQLASDIGEYYIFESPRQTALLPYTKEVLTYLHTKYQLHIISNGFEEVQFIKLKEAGILKYFTHVVLSEKVGVKKPHPLIFKRALQITKAATYNSLMIGDDWYADIYGAQRVNIAAVYFNPKKIAHNNKVDKEISCLKELMKFL